MTPYLAIAKHPHPIQDQGIADSNRRAVCEVRGFCGPFINLAYYSQFPDPAWHGLGECVVCCNTCRVVVQQEKQLAASAQKQ